MSGIRTWFRSWVSGESRSPSEKNVHVVVTESLLLELETQLKELELHYWELEQKERRQQTGVDYSWLVSNSTRSFQIPPVEHSQLVLICQQVQPEECSRIIKLFRDALLRMPHLNEVTGIFKAVITQVIQQRPKEETFTEWFTSKTVSILNNVKYTRPSPRISPISDIIDIERQDKETYPLNSLDTVMYYKNGTDDISSLSQKKSSPFI
ncbi:unnamed protein product [Acanthosepion pharaonis]|uniref:Uncharacterized protein n=1 Tax=Acanthosepion pharaonis TaxID=158019 RepID=A0A812EZY7_ACAPH|nr:unnamed protein product [Sepia pharaonis]